MPSMASASPRRPHVARPAPRRRATARPARANDAQTPANATKKCIAIVTGGAGFIGAHLALALARDARCARVIAVDDFDAHGPYPRAWKRANAAMLTRAGTVDVAEADASDAEAFERVVLDAVARAGDVEGGVDVRIAHLAARSGVGAAAGDAVGATVANALSAVNVLSVASRVNRAHSEGIARVPRVVLASSGSVYGEASMTADGAPMASRVGDGTDHPTSTYAATKRSSELLAKAHVATHASAGAGGVSVIVARIFTVFGPRGRPDMAVWRFIKQLTSGARLTRFGDGQSTWRDYVYVDDVVDALTRALMVDLDVPESSDGFEIVNIAGARPVFLSEIIAACEEACGTSSAVDELPQRPGDVGGTYGDITEATALLDWTPKTTLRDGLRRTVAWWTSPEADEYRDVE
jgi:UDP-glucuronate 4-epimerase